VRLTRRLLLSYLLVIGATVLVLTIAADRLLRSRLVDEAGVQLEREARLLAFVADRYDGPGLDSVVRRLAGATGHRLTVVDRQGHVIADSDFPFNQLEALENHATRPEFRAALAGRTGSDLRLSVSTGRQELKVAVPFTRGAVRISSPLPQVDAVIDRAQGAVLVGAMFAVLAAALLAYGFARNVSQPLVRLRDAAQAIARGERPALDTRGRSEVGELARALRTVDENLNTRLGDLERERSEMAALIGSMVEGVVACDARGTVTMLNPAARSLLGLGPDDVAPPAGELFRHRAARGAVEAALAGQAAEGIEAELGQRTVLLSAHALAHGGAVFVVHDVTALKRLETVRRDFVANVSHELRTPLTVLRGYAETLQKDDPSPDVRAQFVATMVANASRMQQLVDDLLDLSRIESGTWQPRPSRVELEPLVREAWQSLLDAARGNAASLGFATAIAPDAAEAWADPEALREILANLLDNAARYTPSGGRVDVRAAREGRGVRIEVTDTGPGIPGEHLSRIFERFYRVDPARSRELGGTGLGLSIVRHLVEAHGGRVEALSALGSGTTIRIHLPDAPAA
jgi:signal transduction histidine kinase